MNNEELASAIKAGCKELVPVLWGQVQRFLYLKAKDWYSYMPEMCCRAGVELEDLEQETYFAFLDGLQYWDAEKGYTFLTFTMYPMRNRFNALCGRRTSAQRAIPLNNYKSLYTPVGEEEDLYLLDTIRDAAAEEDFLNAEAAICNKQLHDDLEICLATLPELTQEVVKSRYYRVLTFKEVAAEMNISYRLAVYKEREGLCALGRGKNALRLRPYIDDIIQTYAYQSSFSLWNATRTSSTEYTVLKLEQERSEEEALHKRKETICKD